MRLAPDSIRDGRDGRSVDQELDVADPARVHRIRFQGAAAEHARRPKIPDPRRRPVAGGVGEGPHVACEDHPSAGKGGLALRERRCGVARALGELGGADLARVAGSQTFCVPSSSMAKTRSSDSAAVVLPKSWDEVVLYSPASSGRR
jgi:hypothetical protein